MHKNFVLDTNVLLHDPRAIFKFKDNTVNIPIFVIEEIDNFKRNQTELGRNAREVSRLFDEHRKRGSLKEGVKMEHGGILRVTFQRSKTMEKDLLSSEKVDNLILSNAIAIRDEDKDKPCIMVSKDVNLRVRADAFGLRAENYEHGQVAMTQLYPGSCEIDVSDEVIDSLHEDDGVTIDSSIQKPRVSDYTEDAEPMYMDRFYENEYVLLRSKDSAQSSFARVKTVDLDDNEVELQPLAHSSRDDVWGVKARNKEQAFALDALLDDDIKLVCLIGKAGTGKTLLAIAAGLRKVTDEQAFHKLVVSRPIFPMGRDVGYLPGSIEEKMNPWMRPIFDNVEYLMGLTKADKRAGRGADELIDMGIIEIEPLTYIRGRSLPNQYFIVDEAQNLTPHEIKTILTRIGEGSKLVLTGDPYQIDNPYIDSESNGLTFVMNRFKNEKISASVTLFKGERSALAEIAANLL